MSALNFQDPFHQADPEPVATPDAELPSGAVFIAPDLPVHPGFTEAAPERRSPYRGGGQRNNGKTHRSPRARNSNTRNW